MEECELCGRDMGTVHVVSLEGAELRVCAKCSAGKRIVYKENPFQQEQKTAEGKQSAKEERELVADYGQRIRKAREAQKIPVKVLAEMLNEKEHFLARVESQKTTPPDALVRKLERALNIGLKEEE
jgi:putative transcription factor